MRRTLATAAALTLSFTGLGVATAPGAFAATAGASEYGCPGSLIDTYNTPASGEVWGQLRLYYSSANGGTNCAVLLAKKYYGKSHYMEVGINITGEPLSKERSWSSTVCEQSPAAGTPFSADLEPRLVISASCHKD